MEKVTQEELKNLLKKTGMTKRRLAEKVGLSYSTVNNWGSSKNIPHWVESWLRLYIEAKEFRELKVKIRESGICREFVPKELVSREFVAKSDSHGT